MQTAAVRRPLKAPSCDLKIPPHSFPWIVRGAGQMSMSGLVFISIPGTLFSLSPLQNQTGGHQESKWAKVCATKWRGRRRWSCGGQLPQISCFLDPSRIWPKTALSPPLTGFQTTCLHSTSFMLLRGDKYSAMNWPPRSQTPLFASAEPNSLYEVS